MCAEKVEMGVVGGSRAFMPIAQVGEVLKDAQERVSNHELPIAVRIRSKETVMLCEERIRLEGGL